MPAISKVRNTPIFFIIGRPRSGTTLLRHLFDAHPNIIIPEECNFLLTLSLKYKNIKKFNNQQIDQFLSDLKGTKNYKTFPIDQKVLEQNINSLPPDTSLQDLFTAVHFSCLTIHKKNEILIRGDKNPAYSSELFNKLIQSFPEAKYIHLIRDYHDHIASIITGKMVMASPAYMAIAWRKSIERLEKYKKKRPGNFYTIRYEDFVEQPEKCMKAMCEFLKIPYDPNVFEFYKKKETYLTHQPKTNFANNHKSLFNPVNTSRIGNWKQVLKGNELAIVEIIAGKTGKTLGYEFSPQYLNLTRIYLLFKWYFYYYVIIIIRWLVFLLPIKKRYRIVGKLIKNKIILGIYRQIFRRNSSSRP
jgi:hypothetical protein